MIIRKDFGIGEEIEGLHFTIVGLNVAMVTTYQLVVFAKFWLLIAET